jgi:hypothetical protein
MSAEIKKSLLLQKMCEQCVERDKQLPACASRRYSCDFYKCSEQPWKKKKYSLRPDLSAMN